MALPNNSSIRLVNVHREPCLVFFNNSEQGTVKVDAETIVEIATDRPMLVYGNMYIKDAAGNETKRNKVTAFCRCVASNNKPYCDGTHRKIGFKG